MKQTRWASLAVLWALSVTPVEAQTTFHTDWTVREHGTAGLFASTINDSMQTFGKFCFTNSNKCVYLLSLDKSCTKGEKYPILITSKAGALPATLICDELLENGKKQRYIFADYDDIEQVVVNSPKMTIALSTDDDMFTVIRFSMRGALEAMTSMLKKMAKLRVPTGTRDLKM